MDRRAFLQHASLPLGAAALDRWLPTGTDTAPLASSVPPAVHPTRRSSVVVVGGGAFGAWTALHLREQGHTVTLVDAYGPGNSRATSGDETRQLRIGYGDRELYARFAQRAMAAWRQREAEFGVPLLVQTGRLELAPDWTPGMRATAAMLPRLGVTVEAMAKAVANGGTLPAPARRGPGA